MQDDSYTMNTYIELATIFFLIRYQLKDLIVLCAILNRLPRYKKKMLSIHVWVTQTLSVGYKLL